GSEHGAVPVRLLRHDSGTRHPNGPEKAVWMMISTRTVRQGMALLVLLTFAGCSKHEPRAPEGPMTISLTSTAFTANGAIPAVHTCDGRDLSPALAWGGVPAEAK